jgi:hypothetical protein
MAILLKYCALILISGIFLLFGFHVLVAAYQLNDPYAFIMTFFASNFIILISAALIIGLGLRMRHRWRSRHGPPPVPIEPPRDDENDPHAERENGPR